MISHEDKPRLASASQRDINAHLLKHGIRWILDASTKKPFWIKTVVQWAFRGLELESAEIRNKAVAFLQDQLGSCHDLFRTVLRRTISKEPFASHPVSCQIMTTIDPRLEELDRIRLFLQHFNHCLAPLPEDREQVLFKKQRSRKKRFLIPT